MDISGLQPIILAYALSFAASYVAKGFYFTTQRGNIFGFWQDKVLGNKAIYSNQFLYNALGGCLPCHSFWVCLLLFCPIFIYLCDINILLEITISVLMATVSLSKNTQI